MQRPPFWRAVRLVFEACARNARACVAISAVYAVLVAVPNAVFGTLSPDLDLFNLTGAEAVALLAFVVGALGTVLVVGLLVYPAVIGALALVGEAAVVGESVELGAITRRAVDRALQATGAFVIVFLFAMGPPLAVWALLFAASVATGSEPVFVAGLVLPLVLLLPAAYVIVRCSVAVPATMTEGLGPLEAVRRSWALTAGAFWWAAGVFLVTGLAAAAVSGLLSLASTAAEAAGAPGFGVAAVRNVVAGIVSVSIVGVATGVVYAARSIPAAAPYASPPDA